MYFLSQHDMQVLHGGINIGIWLAHEPRLLIPKHNRNPELSNVTVECRHHVHKALSAVAVGPVVAQQLGICYPAF